jgi:hypothetical protein
MRRLFIMGLALGSCAVMSCGNAELRHFDERVVMQFPPTVTRVSPTSAKAGDTVTIVGIGFSVIPADNIIQVGSSVTVAQTYALTATPAEGELEQITFTVPVDVGIGAASLALSIYDNTSNANIAVTVTE